MSSKFVKITDQTIKELVDIFGRENVSTQKNELEAYSHDEMPFATPHNPQIVVKPDNVKSIARFMCLANKKKIPVTPRGAGTGLSGGCVPLFGGILISFERMNKILEIDKKNSVEVVEAGVTLSDICNSVVEQGLYYPVHIGEMTSTIGGIISTNAGGMNAVKYGVTRHNVLGLEAVMPNGETIKTGGRFAKCSTGYDITQLLIGSEGTLAIITKAILKLTTKPGKKNVLLAPFMQLENALDAIPEILDLEMIPTGVEFMERSILELVEKYQKIKIPYLQHQAYLMITIEEESDDQTCDYFAKVEEICRRYEAVDAVIPGSGKAQRKLIDAREQFYHAIKQHSPMVVIDVVVPRSAIKEFVIRAKAKSAEMQIPLIVYGHAGDGNVHLHPCCENIARSEWIRKIPHLVSEIYKIGTSLGGAISGEHGIGYDKKVYFQNEAETPLYNAMKAIKKAFDPNGILNPGKLFD
ncbi:MAG: FAD-binding oxidoreductase [Dehalococcoidia bacterium]|nr:MAG: FAD-binding oxidoreductase [Dehalococcoidia bacterium]